MVGDLDGVAIEEGLAATKERVIELFPSLAGMEVIGGWGGTMPFTPDQNIICGSLEPGLFVCTGAPFTKGPASGLLLAEAVVHMAWPCLAPRAEYLTKCSPMRFRKE